MALQKNDFLEIEFTGKVKGMDEIFDSNIPSELKKINPDFNPEQAKPFKFALGQKMFLEGIDNSLIGKEIKSFPEELEIELTPENAFGKREARLIQMIPMKIFHEHKINPIPGAMFNFDNRAAKVLTVSGGRVMVDFNNPLSGKDVLYKIKILRKIDDKKEKIDSLNDFLFRKELPFEIKDKKIILKVDKGLKQFVEMFKDKYKELFDLELEVEETGSKKMDADEIKKEMPTSESMKDKVEEKIEEAKERLKDKA